MFTRSYDWRRPGAGRTSSRQAVESEAARVARTPGQIVNEEQLFLRVARRQNSGLSAALSSVEMGIPRSAVEDFAKSLAVKQRIVELPGTRYISAIAFAAASKIFWKRLSKPSLAIRAPA